MAGSARACQEVRGVLSNSDGHITVGIMDL